jgi:hypothetical protein
MVFPLFQVEETEALLIYLRWLIIDRLIDMKNISLLFLSVISILFLGCGEEHTNKDTTEQTSYLIDSPISGAEYRCDDISGFTGARGEFRYKNDCNVTFSIGNLILGTVSSVNIGSYVIINDLIGVDRNVSRDPKLILLARFLQSIDEDEDTSNGIMISDSTRALLSSVADANATNLTSVQLGNIVAAVGNVFISEDLAVEHLEATLQNSFQVLVDTIPPVWTTDINYSDINVTEGNKFVTTMIATDKNSLVLYDFVNTADANIFTLDRRTGKLSFTTAPDYESGTITYTVPIIATDSFHDVQISVVINIIDTIDSIDTIADKNLTTPEDTPKDTIIGSIDVNNTINDDIDIIRLSGIDSEYFRVDKDGNVYVAKELDYETIKLYNLIATPINTAGAGEDISLVITIINVPDTKPILQDNHTFYVDENVSLLSFVGQINILLEDIDISNFFIERASPAVGTTHFIIDADGNITNISPLDYESIREYNLTVYAIPNGIANLDSKRVVVRIVVNDIIDEVPLLGDINLSIEENQSIGTVVGSVPIINSGDSDIVSFDLNGTNSGDFTIDRLGVIRTAIVLDYETTDFYDLNATAVNSAGRSIGNNVDINVTDKFEVLATMGDANFTIVENNTPTSVLGNANLIDAGDSNVTDYRLLGLGNEKFSIDSNGLISVIATLNYEDKTFYHFTVGARNSLGWSEGGDVNIIVTDLPDLPPEIREPYREDSYIFYIDENATLATQVSTTYIPIILQGDTNVTGFVLTGTGNADFDINISGYIFTNTFPLDFETKSVYNLTAYAENISTPNKSNEVNITIYLNNIPEFVPEMEDNQTFEIDENQSIGTIVGELNITSIGDTNITQIILSGDENASHFVVDNNGIIRTTIVLDYETQRDYNLTATATNLAGDSNQSNIFIRVLNVAERYVVLENRDYNISENEENGTLIGTIGIIDKGDTNITDVILRGQNRDRFRIDIVSNDEILLYTNAILDYEDIEQYFFNIVAINGLGVSDEYNITISVINIYEFAPSVEDTNFTIPETTPINTYIGDVNITNRGDSNITEIRILGVGKDDFRVDLDGGIYVANDLNYSNQDEYNLTIFIRNLNGDTNTSALDIAITDVLLYNPILNNTIIDINETTTISSIKIGDLNFATRGDSNITEIVFTGINRDKFTIDLDGNIEINNTILDYENPDDRSFIFEVIARNSKGYSNTANIIIRVHNIAERAPILDDTILSIAEDVPINTLVGYVDINDSGDTNITNIVILGTGGAFKINSSGAIFTAVGLDFSIKSIYNLTAYATNEFGDSNTVDVTINLTDVNRYKPVINSATIDINETNVISSIKIGDIDFATRGDSNITEIRLVGDNSDKFRVDLDGNIEINNTILDYENPADRVFVFEVIARNTKGYNEVRANLVIIVHNIAEFAPILNDVNIATNENISINTLIGSILINSMGDTNITSFIFDSGAGREEFKLNKFGNIFSAVDLNATRQGTYTLTAYATNEFGDSNVINVNIIVTDVFNNAPVLNNTVLNVDENEANGVVVGRVSVSSFGDSNVTNFILTGAGSEHFNIDNNGTIYVDNTALGSLNYEADRVFNLLATAINQKGPSNDVSVTININNIPEVTNVLADTNITVSETTAVGTIVGNINITTLGDTNSTFTLLGTGAVDFYIHSDGRVELIRALDFETKSFYTLVTSTRDSIGDSNEVNVNITVTNVLETEPQLVNSVLSFDENSPIGTFVGNIDISTIGDSPILEFQLYGDDEGNFTVNLDGSVYVNVANIDFEQIQRFDLFARARNSLGFGNDITVTINVNNVAETAPVLVDTAMSFDENRTVGTIIGRVDITSIGDTNITSFSVTGVGSTNFSIRANGDVVLEAIADFEAVSVYNLMVLAINSFGASNLVRLDISVNDSADVAPVLENRVFNIDENLTVGTYIGDINISSIGDSTVTLVELFGTNSADFVVEANGSVYTRMTLDFETKPIYNLTARATNSAGFSNISDVVINVSNIAENLPIASDATFSVDENISIASIVGTIGVTSTDSNITSVTLSPTTTSFNIDTNGTITTLLTLDYETTTSYTFDVNFTNGAGSRIVSVVINVNNTPETLVVLSDLNLTINENQTDGVIIGAITVTAGDTNTTSLVLTGAGSEHFAISSTGVISVASAIDIEYEKQSFYFLSVVATNDFGESNSTLKITIRDTVSSLLTSKIVATDRTPDDEFGTSVAVFGDYVIVGAPGQDTDRKNIGAAYVYKKTSPNDAFIQIEELQYNTTTTNAYFGYSVAINSGYVAIGAYGSNIVYVYKRVGDDYVLAKTLSGSGQFGYSLAMDDNLLLVGAPQNGTNAHGSVFGYDVNNDFTQSLDLDTVSTQSNENFGNSISIDANYIVVGAHNADQSPSNIDTGAVYIFARQGGFISKVFAQNSHSNDNFGRSVSVYGNIVLVGAPNKDHNSSSAQDTGAVYVLEIDSQNQVNQSVIEPSTLKAFDGFGYSVSLNEHRAYIGTYNKDIGTTVKAGLVYSYSLIGSTSGLLSRLDGNTTAYTADIEQEANFGSALASSDNHLVIGAYHKDEDSMQNSGAVYIKTYKPDNRPYLVNYDPIIYYTSDVRDFEAAGTTTPIRFSWIWGVLTISTTRGLLSGAGAVSPSETTGNVVVDDAINAMSYILTAIKKDISILIGGNFLFDSPSWLNSNDFFGGSIAVDGSNVIVGSIGYDLNSTTDLGIVYRYTGGATLTFENNITLQDINDTTADKNTFFGSSIAINGTFGAIGASGGDMNVTNGSGNVYILENITAVTPANSRKVNFNDFVFTGDIINKGDNFGNAISISNIVSGKHYVAIGASNRDGISGSGATNSGVIYIFTHTPGDPKITQVERLGSNDIAQEDFLADEHFGFALDISKDSNYLVVGVPSKDWGNNIEAGSAYVFKKNASDEYVQVDRIVLPDAESGDHFGYSVSINTDGGYIVIGAPNDSLKGYVNSGAIYLYKKDASDRYIQVSKSGVYDSDYGDNLGNSIDINGNYIAVGAYGKFNKDYRTGATYLFKITNDKLYEIYAQKLDQVSANEEFGSFVGLDAAGAPSSIYMYSTSPVYNNKGRMFLFDINDN